jgi:gamma-glutamylcysteine synthetase
MTIFEKRDEKYREVARLRDALERAIAEAKEYDTLIELAQKHKYELHSAADTIQKVVEQTVTRAFSTEKSQKQRVVEAAEAILADGVRRYSRDVLREMEKMGITLTTQDPVGTLSVYLSREKDIFTSDVKAGGWTLRRLQKKARPEDVAASRASVSTAH